MIFAVVQTGNIGNVCSNIVLAAQSAEEIARYRLNVIERFQTVGSKARRYKGYPRNSLGSPLGQLGFGMGRNPRTRILEARVVGNGPVGLGYSKQLHCLIHAGFDLLHIGITRFDVRKGDRVEREKKLAAWTILPNIAHGCSECLCV